jgi:hypothetical protein
MNEYRCLSKIKEEEEIEKEEEGRMIKTMKDTLKI